MSDAIAFDSHEFVKNLIQNGFTEKQAEVLAKEQVALLNGNLANKQDMAVVHRDIEALRQETKQSIAVVHKDIEALRLETKQSIAVIHRDIEALRQETKQDIEALRQETKQDIEALRQETKQSIEVMQVEVKRDFALLQRDIETIKSDLVKWMFAALLGHSALVVSLVVALV